MFDNIGDMPLHPLVVHAAVVAVPLATLLALMFALPRTREWSRWALALVGLGAAGATIVARLSGPALQQQLKIVPGNPVGDKIAVHAQLASQLVVITIVLAVLAVLNALVVSRGRRATTRSAVNVILPVLLVLVALVAMYWTYRVGDIGSRAVWNPTS